jgi:hypothetical protein
VIEKIFEFDISTETNRAVSGWGILTAGGSSTLDREALMWNLI